MTATALDQGRRLHQQLRRSHPSRLLTGGRVDWAALLGLAGWLLLVGLALRWGPSLVTEEMSVGAPPFMGSWRQDVTSTFLVPLLVAGAVVAFGPALAATSRWWQVALGSGVATTVWCTAMASVYGWHRVALPLASEHEYLAVVDRIEDPGTFLRTFPEQMGDYPIHVQGHPPGVPLLLWAMDRLGLGGAEWAAALVIAAGGVATVATLVAVRSVAGETAARRAAPFLILAPAVLWLGTSTDTLFTGVIAAGIALLVAGRRPVMYAAGGTVLGLALYMTYGAVPLLLIPVGVWLYRRNLVPLLWAAGGLVAVAVLYRMGGFWWFDGLAATREAYDIGIASARPYSVFVWLLNPAALAFAVGPATAAGFALLLATRGRAEGDGNAARVEPLVWLLPVLALVAVAAADLSGLSKAEVERIWLPFVPWLLVATATLRWPRVWLALQAGLALLLEAVLASPW